MVNGRSFYQNGNVWLDSTAQQKLKQRQVKFNQRRIFRDVARAPRRHPVFALGSDVDVVIGDTLYQVRGD